MRLHRHLVVKNEEIYWRNIIFGVEDGLVSTVGLLSGVAAAGIPKETILITGVILVFVEAFSMGIGSLLTEISVEELQSHREMPLRQSILSGIVMFFSYLFAGFVPILPYLLFSTNVALIMSIILSIFALILLGVVSAKIFKVPVVRHSLEIAILGAFAIIIGVLVANLMKLNV